MRFAPCYTDLLQLSLDDHCSPPGGSNFTHLLQLFPDHHCSPPGGLLNLKLAGTSFPPLIWSSSHGCSIELSVGAEV